MAHVGAAVLLKFPTLDNYRANLDPFEALATPGGFVKQVLHATIEDTCRYTNMPALCCVVLAQTMGMVPRRPSVCTSCGRSYRDTLQERKSRKHKHVSYVWQGCRPKAARKKRSDESAGPRCKCYQTEISVVQGTNLAKLRVQSWPAVFHTLAHMVTDTAPQHLVVDLNKLRAPDIFYEYIMYQWCVWILEIIQHWYYVVLCPKVGGADCPQVTVDETAWLKKNG